MQTDLSRHDALIAELEAFSTALPPLPSDQASRKGEQGKMHRGREKGDDDDDYDDDDDDCDYRKDKGEQENGEDEAAENVEAAILRHRIGRGCGGLWKWKQTERDRRSESSTATRRRKTVIPAGATTIGGRRGKTGLADALVLSRALLHASDVSNPGKERAVAAEWQALLAEEFLRQGDDERRRGLPVPPQNDRRSFSAAASVRFSAGFASAVVAPLLRTLSRQPLCIDVSLALQRIQARAEEQGVEE